MSYRISQLSPQGSTGSVVNIATRAPFPDAQFWQSWVESDAGELTGGNPRRINWNAVFGLGLTLAISCAFWTGIGLIATRLWK